MQTHFDSIEQDGQFLIRRHVLRGIWTIAACDTKETADQFLALLRFQSAMTPEMWDSLAYALRTDAAGDKVKSALDTLRQELQQP